MNMAGKVSKDREADVDAIWWCQAAVRRGGVVRAWSLQEVCVAAVDDEDAEGRDWMMLAE